MRVILFCEEEYRYEENRAGTGCRAGSDEHGRLRAGLYRQGQGPTAGRYQRINSGLCKTTPQGPAIPPLPSDSRSTLQQKAPAGCRGQVCACSQWRCLIPSPRDGSTRRCSFRYAANLRESCAIIATKTPNKNSRVTLLTLRFGPNARYASGTTLLQKCSKQTTNK
jgi:hypothetical protein